MRIDAHQHYWKLSRGDYGWLSPQMPTLYRDYLPADLQPSLAAHRIDGTIAVQAAQTLEETDYLLELAEREPSILGVVGWLDPADPACVAHYERHSRHPKYVGFRIMIQELADAETILEPGYVARLRELAQRDAPIDLLVLAHQLDPLVRLLDQIPELRGVVDHLAKPPIAAGELEPWRSRMAEIAAHPGIYCKLSGMVTEADHDGWRPEDLTPYVRAVWELFGPERVMYGSDWPVCLLASSYDRLAEALEQALPEGLSAAQRGALYGGNAAAFYKLNTKGDVR
ncbi:amidohydrolase family protein [Paenibacillus sp. IB182496]|uniref:Amidohydrolase family protein n=1 Tax=Paenibacillus sabuli TaxID=2772509 RepID=A0A927GRM1_9BACL|nr:amidohydrolase family protein [Paenibacillus sabuli]MBD2845643.1 amidohydrolase family protein [Paenibacillus sabuli]